MLPRDLEPFPAKAKGRREMLEVADVYLKLEAGQCSCERRPWTYRKSIAEIGDTGDRHCGLARVRGRRFLGR